MSYRILAINPGSTSTKVALFEDEKELFKKSVQHDAKTLLTFPNPVSQLDFRYGEITKFLEENQVDLNTLSAVVGRGGFMKPLVCGTYLVNEAMIHDLRTDPRRHESTLGVLIADQISRQYNIPAYTVDPITVFEALPIARIGGLKGMDRPNTFHPLNHKEVGRRAAATLGKTYEQCNFIIAHIGGGSSVVAHSQGVAIDSNGAERGTASFTGLRAGGVHIGQLVDKIFADQMNLEQVNRMLMKEGGLFSHLGTDDGLEIERRIDNGDEYAALVYEALAYNHAKEIGSMAAVLEGKVDAIILTGGYIYSERIRSWISQRVSWISPIICYPGEREMEALNMRTLLVLRGELECKTY